MAVPFAGGRRKPDRAAALAQYRQRAGVYDAELLAFEPIRTEAIERLKLRAGETVIDVGCGTGLSFELLANRVGHHGHIIGIEQCPEMLAQARERVRHHHWINTVLLEESVVNAPIKVHADAALFHFTHDILRDGKAVAHVMAHLKPGARVVATGLQWAPPWMWPTNGFVLLAAMHSVTSFEGLGRPWDKLAAHLADVRIDTAMLGGIFIASGVLARQ